MGAREFSIRKIFDKKGLAAYGKPLPAGRTRRRIRRGFYSSFTQSANILLQVCPSALCVRTYHNRKGNVELFFQFLKVGNQAFQILHRSRRHALEDTVDKMTAMYDGYHYTYSEDGLFNPFSVLNVFDGLMFDNYWFQTGTPTYLVDLLKQSDYDLRLLIDGLEVGSSGFAEYRAEAKNPLPMIYQSGYLTIKNFDKSLNLYTLGFPNDEVKYGFLKFLIPYYTPISSDETDFNAVKFVRELQSGDVHSFMERMKSFFADIPYELNTKTERHYQVIFYLVFKLMGQYVDAEVRSAKGRADAVVETKDRIYVFEFKLEGTVDEALKQIDEKGYLLPYQTDGRELVKVGVSFNAEERNIGEYKVV